MINIIEPDLWYQTWISRPCLMKIPWFPNSDHFMGWQTNAAQGGWVHHHGVDFSCLGRVHRTKKTVTTLTTLTARLPCYSCVHWASNSMRILWSKKSAHFWSLQNLPVPSCSISQFHPLPSTSGPFELQEWPFFKRSPRELAGQCSWSICWSSFRVGCCHLDPVVKVQSKGTDTSIHIHYWVAKIYIYIYIILYYIILYYIILYYIILYYIILYYIILYYII